MIIRVSHLCHLNRFETATDSPRSFEASLGEFEQDNQPVSRTNVSDLGHSELRRIIP